jgi:phosphoribosylformylglycinamidine synthase
MVERKRELAINLGLSNDEYERILSILQRDPTEAEIAVFAAMWNEHVSYKSSRVYLKEFPTKTKDVLVGPGENAGVVSVGNGYALAFKIESHNHPSFIEPFQGAATGVGGILRDIFTMGARPFAVMDSLWFGSLKHPRTQYIAGGVVSGIAFYGNCMGVPTVGGETNYDEAYDHNCLVNVFAIGIVREDRIFFGKASGNGNKVVYVGSTTGRDGIQGAIMASQTFGDEAGQKRPTVQVGDPFTEKVLMEACLEAMEQGLVLGIQDMGAAGLTCSTVEMASRGGDGIRVDLDLVPLRAKGMSAPEILLSESQERMLLVARPEDCDRVLEVFRKWDINANIIGEVTDTNRVEMYFGGQKVVDCPVSALTDDAPLYKRPYEKPAYLEETQKMPRVVVEEDIHSTFLRLIDDFAFRSKRPIYEQYDHMVQIRTVIPPEKGDSAVMRLVEVPPKGVAMTLDGNGAKTYLNPWSGGFNVVAEALLNLACVGARCVGITDCLNFGSPENKEVMWQFREAVLGIAEACRAFGVPVTGGNVSFYNETNERPIFPTPVIGAVGIVEDCSKCVGMGFVDEGDEVLLLGDVEGELDGSLFIRRCVGILKGNPKCVDVLLHKRMIDFLCDSIEKGKIKSAHDISDGGLLFTLAECMIASEKGLGVRCRIGIEKDKVLESLFGEGRSRVVVSVPCGSGHRFLEDARKSGIPARIIGEVCRDALRIEDVGLCVPIKTLLAFHEKPLPGI